MLDLELLPALVPWLNSRVEPENDDHMARVVFWPKGGQEPWFIGPNDINSAANITVWEDHYHAGMWVSEHRAGEEVGTLDDAWRSKHVCATDWITLVAAVTDAANEFGWCEPEATDA